MYIIYIRPFYFKSNLTFRFKALYIVIYTIFKHLKLGKYSEFTCLLKKETNLNGSIFAQGCSSFPF